jgi:DNA repair protein RecO (recombination protein O)
MAGVAGSGNPAGKLAGKHAGKLADIPGFILHSYPYSETSLLIEVFTRDHGRVPLIAKGAKRPHSSWRGVLLAFQPLMLSWSGRGDVKTLTAAEWQGGLPMLSGRALACGFYLNELLLKLLAREDGHPKLFDTYRQTLEGLAGVAPSDGAADQAACLRRFELRLLSELGYGLSLTHEADGRRAVERSVRYHYVFERGPMPYGDHGDRGFQEMRDQYPEVSGQTLLAMADESFDDAAVRAEAKTLFRALINRMLDRQPLHSRQLLRDLQTLDESS